MTTDTKQTIVLPGEDYVPEKNKTSQKNDRVELPIVTEEDPLKKHISILLITDGLKQVEKNLTEQEANIKKYNEQLQQLSNMRIASLAQKNLLQELQTRILELDGVNVIKK
jgi:hypothetical protein